MNYYWHQCFFGAFIYMIVLFVYFAFIDVSVKVAIRAFSTFLVFGTYCLVYGFKFAATKNMLINLKTRTLISRYIIGPFSYDVKLKVTEFEYVSFFEDGYGEFGTNLWYVKTRHYKMYSFVDKESAFQFSLNLSNKLNIDLLDATEKGNFKWVEKEMK